MSSGSSAHLSPTRRSSTILTSWGQASGPSPETFDERVEELLEKWSDAFVIGIKKRGLGRRTSSVRSRSPIVI